MWDPIFLPQLRSIFNKYYNTISEFHLVRVLYDKYFYCIHAYIKRYKQISLINGHGRTLHLSSENDLTFVLLI